MHLPQGLGQFWQRLTSLQKVSLISLVLVLLALPAGLYLTGQSQEIRKKAAEEIQIPQLPQVTKPEGEFVELPVTGQSGQISISSLDSPGPSVNLSGPEKGYINQELKYSATVGSKDIWGVWMRWRTPGAAPNNRESWTYMAERLNLSVWQCDPSFWFKITPSFQCTSCASGTACPITGDFIPDKPGNYHIQVSAYDNILGNCGLFSTGSPNCQPRSEIIVNVSAVPPPTATISGPTSGKTGEAMVFSAKAQGEQLQWTRIHWAKATSDLTQGSSWTMVSENAKCNDASECSVSGNFTPAEAGEYWLAVTANNPGGPCSGNPKVAELPGWVDCGSNSRVKITVAAAQKEGQTLNLSTGYNLVGITVDKGKYNAENFLKDLNSSFSGGSKKILYIFRYNVDAGVWESYPKIEKVTTNNFFVVPWEAYIIYSRASGTAKISGGGVSLPDSIRIPSGWSLWSAPTTLADIPDAKTLLAKAKEQEIDLLSIWKWDAGAKQYVGHKAGSSENNFSLVAGEGYWIYNGGAEKQFSLTTIPLPPTP